MSAVGVEVWHSKAPEKSDKNPNRGLFVIVSNFEKEVLVKEEK